jgi:hypothetical protein
MKIWHGYTVGINDTMCLKCFIRNNLENQIRKKWKKITTNYKKLVIQEGGKIILSVLDIT